MKSVEMDQNDNKKVWMTPEFEVLDSGKTFGGIPNLEEEDDDFCQNCKLS